MWDHKQRNAGASGSGKRKETFSPGASRRNQPCDTLILAGRDLCQISDLQTVR